MHIAPIAPVRAATPAALSSALSVTALQIYDLAQARVRAAEALPLGPQRAALRALADALDCTATALLAQSRGDTAAATEHLRDADLYFNAARAAEGMA